MTFVIVMIGWVIFYYTDFSAVMQHLAALVGAGGALPFTDDATVAVLRKYTVFPLIAFVLSLPVIPAVGQKLSGGVRTAKLVPALKLILVLALFVFSVLFLIGQSYNPFIYFRF